MSAINSTALYTVAFKNCLHAIATSEDARGRSYFTAKVFVSIVVKWRTYYEVVGAHIHVD